MHRAVLAGVLGAAVAALAGAAPAFANHGHGNGDGHGDRAVFVQTNDPAGNEIAVYDRAGDGTLTRAGTYATGGLGGIASPGTESDHLASQGSLALTRSHHLLIAVNAGSDTISVFRVHGGRLQLMQVLPSGGQFPASIGASRNLVYVLNSVGTGIVQGFRV